MRGRRLILCSVAMSLMVTGTWGAIGDAAANAPLGSLLLRAHDVGPGYYESASGYTGRCGILEPGIPIPSVTRAIQQHGFIREFFDDITTHRIVKNFVELDIRENGDKFSTAAGGHWAFLQAKNPSPQNPLYLQKVSLGAVGDESFGMIPPGGNSQRGIVFRQGRYLVQMVLFHRPAQPARLVTLARLVDGRLKAAG